MWKWGADVAMGLTMLALTLAGVSAGVQAVGSVKAGNAAKRAGEKRQEAAESEAQLADYNAAVAALQATDATQRGAQDEQRFRSGIRQVVGSQRAGFAAGNIDVGYGSAVDVQADATFLGELDALTIRTNAAREAWGYSVQAEDYRKRAEITRKEGVAVAAAGREEQKASRFAAAGTLVGTGASLLEARYGFGRRGK